MNIILMNIGFGLMTVAVVALYLANRRLIKELKETSDTLAAADEAVKSSLRLIGDLNAHLIDQELSLVCKAEVEERFTPIPHFAVYRKGVIKKHDVAHIGYRLNDPDDRDYKRIHAEEVAEKLNEKP